MIQRSGFRFLVRDFVCHFKFGFMISRKGFTLIELLVYVALLATVSLVVVNSVLILNRTLASFRLERRLTTSAEVVMGRITRELHLADALYASSTLWISPGVLSLASRESEEDATSKDVMIYTVNGALLLRRATGSPAVLTGDGVAVTNLVFKQITNGTVSTGVKVELTLNAFVGSASTTKNYYTTVVLRGSY